MLQPGQCYLVHGAKGSGGSVAATPDTTGIIAMSGFAGQALIAQQTTGVSSRDTATVVDYVASPGLTSATSASRANGGCADKDAAADCSTSPVAPRTTASPLNVCP